MLLDKEERMSFIGDIRDDLAAMERKRLIRTPDQLVAFNKVEIAISELQKAFEYELDTK